MLKPNSKSLSFRQKLGQNVDYKTSINHLSQKVERIEIVMGKLSSAIESLTATILSLQSSQGGSSNDSVEIASLQTSVTTLTNSVEAISTQVGTASSSITTLESSVSTLTTSVSDIETKVTAIQASVSTDETSGASLATRVTTLETEIDEAVASINALVNDKGNIPTLTAIETAVSVVEGVTSKVHVATGGVAPYKLTITSSNGATVAPDSDGTSVDYTNSTVGSDTLTVTVEDASGASITSTVSVTVVAAPVPLSAPNITETAAVGVATPFTISPTGGTAPYNYSINPAYSGPSSVSLNGDILEYTASAAGTETIDVVVADFAGTTVSITVVVTAS